MIIAAADGVSLVADDFGPVDGVPVLLTGGIGQTRHAWRRAAEQIAADGRRAIIVDLRGHGDSGWSSDGDYGYPRFASDIEAVVRWIGRPAVLVGASLGGKISLAAAGYGGVEIGRAVVMIDVVPRNNWQGRPDALRAPPEGFVSLDAAADALAQSRGRTAQPGAGDRLRPSMRMDKHGRWHWHWDPALMDRDHGLGRDAALPYLEGAAARVTVPVLVARAELSDEVTEEGIASFRALVPQVEVETIPGATHMLVGDRNDAFAASLNAFLRRTIGP